MRETVTLFVPEGYANGEEFAADCGFEISRPPPIPWNVYYNRSYGPVETRAAEIYATFEYTGPGEKPSWVPGGNSERQDDARVLARRELYAVGHDPSAHGEDVRDKEGKL